MVADLVETLRPTARDIEKVLIVGNTVMHHLFCDIDVCPLAGAPFETREPELRCFRAAELGWNVASNPPVCFLPCLASFIGSDILAGILATGMHRHHTPMVLIDLGTNGEIALGDRERILLASTAAGPAFEGGRISMGMRATTGAIDSVSAENARLTCHVIGGGEPRGICGSGLVDAVAVGLENGLVLPSGRLSETANPLQVAPTVALTQTDIRQLQLAKAAIAAGLKILRRRFAEDECRDAPIYLAGAFGNYVNRTSAGRIGLIDRREENIHAAGNTALLGAKMALFENDLLETEFAEIRRCVQHVALATDRRFLESFVEETLFPDW